MLFPELDQQISMFLWTEYTEQTVRCFRREGLLGVVSQRPTYNLKVYHYT